MTRMTLSACVAMVVVVLAAILAGRPPGASVEQITPEMSSFDAILGPTITTELERRSEDAMTERPGHTTEVRSILAARRQLGGVLEGTALDDQQSSRVFVESLDRLIDR